jgi:hypothetical protein
MANAYSGKYNLLIIIKIQFQLNLRLMDSCLGLHVGARTKAFYLRVHFGESQNQSPLTMNLKMLL